MDERQKDLSNYRITQADDSLKVADYCLKETNESIYITQNDEGDMVIKSIDTYEKREQLLRLRARVLQAEWERIDGVLSRSPMTVKRSLNELETAGLIMRVRQGIGEPNRIYVLIPGKEDAALA